MSQLLEQHEAAGLRCYPSRSDPDSFYFLPAAPEPERDSRGRPGLTLWVGASGGRLQLGARWGAAPEALAALKRELLRAHPELSAATLRLQPAPLGDVSAELALGDGETAPMPIARVTSSGFMPYAALFNVALDDAQRERVLAALHGRAGFLTLTYRGLRSGVVTATVTIAGDVTIDLAELPADPGAEACLAQVAAALEAGRLTLTHAGDMEAPEELWRRAEEQALARAAVELHRLHGGAQRPTSAAAPRTTEAALHAEASLSATTALPVARRVDVADWFAAGEGAAHVRTLSGDVVAPRKPDGAGGVPPPPPAGPGDPAGPGTSTPPPAGPGKPNPGVALTVGLAFAPAGLPVAFVRLQRGAWSATLRGPAFAAIELPADSAGPLEVTTSYTLGAPYSATLDTPGPTGFALTPADLGLAEVIVDGQARREAGAREVRLRLRYKAAGAGSDDDRTVYLRRDDWTARWFLITRSPTLDGSLELEWREVGANGAPTWQRPRPIDTTTITL